MFDILRKSFATGVVTSSYPATPAEVSKRARGCPEVDFPNLREPAGAIAACPTGALRATENNGRRIVTLDLANCTLCGLCAEIDPAIRMTNRCELAVTTRTDLLRHAEYEIAGKQPAKFLRQFNGASTHSKETSPSQRNPSAEALGAELQTRIQKTLGRSLHIREVDAGSCNGCEIEIVGLNSPIYDIERFGIHFVASPRHADMLLVTGPVSRNMELALKKSYDATPDPRVVVAVGACACAGGMFGQNYATVGSVDKVIPVDVYVPGCPPNPHALLHGILLAVGRLAGRKANG